MDRIRIVFVGILLTFACRHRQGPALPPEVVPVDPAAADAAVQGCIKRSRTYDPVQKACREPTDRECLERNQYKSTECIENWVNEHKGPTLVDFKAICEVNSKGAFINCKDSEVEIPVEALTVTPVSPDWLPTALVSLQQAFSLSVKSVGDIHLTVEGTSGGPKVLDINHLTENVAVTKQNPVESLRVKLQFAPDVIIHSASYIQAPHQAVRVDDLQRIVDESKLRKIHAKWLADEEVRLRSADYMVKGTYSEWIGLIRAGIPGAPVWNLKANCPSALAANFSFVYCKEDITVQDKEEWRGKPFVNTCDSTGNIVRENAGNRVGILNYGVFPKDAFKLEIAANTQFSRNCFVQVLELDE